MKELIVVINYNYYNIRGYLYINSVSSSARRVYNIKRLKIFQLYK